MEFPQNLTGEIVNIWDLSDMDLMYQYPLLMHVESGYPEGYPLALGNFQLEQFRPYFLESTPRYYLAPVSDNNIATRFFQNQNEDIRFQFTSQEEQGIPKMFGIKNSPELNDVKNVPESKANEKVVQKILEDEDDEVIFVKEYKSETAAEKPSIKNEYSLSICTRGASSSNSNNSVRRNPSRKARNARSNPKLAEEHFVEGDLAFLDESDDDDLVFLKPSNSPTSTASSSSNENFKVWPTNVHERPEYNPKIDQTDPFDYTIKEIQKSYVKRKQRLETTFKSKPKKRYFTRRRKSVEPKPEKKVPINEIAETIHNTYDLLKEFYEEQGKNAERFQSLVKYQSVLNDILDDFREINNFDTLLTNKS